ncbi:uncharacterized protein F5891DRAFT_985296 [Suillus fuscotomentosus]|uniref:Uncharacterized protein n=1 Tax=Suillus fuscotomentosus TaxID=1912939 RepID=A0AAD4DUM9_9AGAM|nr:uncharacterized protein F5891DRAFT_985296 [Suillus fuscotomentosus]KAG1894182.1 hypothetical protein F5891DRAFT_985296 [Suillus fuscotomentosus]
MPESNCAGNLPAPTTVVSLCVSMSPQARAKRKIAALMEEVENLKQEKAIKQGGCKNTYYVSQGRALRMVVLYCPLEDLVARMTGVAKTQTATTQSSKHSCSWYHVYLNDEQTNRLQHGYIESLKRGADSAHGDDTGTLKELVASWVNIECRSAFVSKSRPISTIEGFVNDACGKLLCPAEWCWEDPVVRAEFVTRYHRFYCFRKFLAYVHNLERGLFKFQAISHGMRKGNSSRDRICSLPDFFEDPPGPAALARVNKLLKWWTRKVFGRNHGQDLTPDVILHMSVNSLASQRQQMEDAAFNSN